MASTLVMPSKESGVTAVAEETLQFDDDDLRGEEKYSFFCNILYNDDWKEIAVDNF